LLAVAVQRTNGGNGRSAVFEQRIVNGGSRHGQALKFLMFSLRQRPLMADSSLPHYPPGSLRY
jgi:hypothetical protein